MPISQYFITFFLLLPILRWLFLTTMISSFNWSFFFPCTLSCGFTVPHRICTGTNSDNTFAVSWKMEPYILILRASAAAGWMASYWETLILCCLHTFFPLYSHIPPLMSLLFLYSNYPTRLIDTMIQRTAMVLSMNDGQKSTVTKKLHLVLLPDHT